MAKNAGLIVVVENFMQVVDASDTTDLEIVLESDNCRAEQMLPMQEQLLDRMQQFHDKIL